MNITEKGIGIFEVSSESSAEITYIVNLDTRIPTCTCVAFVMKRNKVKKATGSSDGGWCKHLDAARYEQAKLDRERQKTEEEQVEMEMARIRLMHINDELK